MPITKKTSTANEMSAFPFQVDHINKLLPIFKYQMVIVVREKILYAM